MVFADAENTSLKNSPEETHQTFKILRNFLSQSMHFAKRESKND